MKITLIAFLIVFGKLSFAQTNYYTFNRDSLWTEEDVRSTYEKLRKTVPPSYRLVPTIYHKVIKKDSIINYITFSGEKNAAPENEKFAFTFKQDSVFLFLNKKLPDFKLLNLIGNEFSSDELKGKPALINFWGIYCGPCIAEMPELSALKDKYGSDMNFLGLTEDISKENSLVKFLEKHPFNYHILQDAGDYKKTLKIGAIPRNIFIDKEGYIRYIQGNFPYTKYDPANGIREYDKNNYFVRIIEELIGR